MGKGTGGNDKENACSKYEDSAEERILASSWIHSYTVEEPPVQSTTNRPIWQLDADSDAPAGELCRAPFDPDRLGNPERTPPTPATIAGELSWSVATASWSAEASDNADSAFDGTLGFGRGVEHRNSEGGVGAKRACHRTP